MCNLNGGCSYVSVWGCGKGERVKILKNLLHLIKRKNAYQEVCQLCLKASLQPTICVGSILGIRSRPLNMSHCEF